LWLRAKVVRKALVYWQLARADEILRSITSKFSWQHLILVVDGYQQSVLRLAIIFHRLFSADEVQYFCNGRIFVIHGPLEFGASNLEDASNLFSDFIYAH
jgi:hypothetical protein